MKNKNQGFTLVELVVSFVILMILVSMSLAGFLAYQDFADYKRENSYAQTLFSAAQTELTGMSVRGEMSRLYEVSDTPLFLDQLITESGARAKESAEGLETKQHTIYTLTGSREAYQKYLAGEYKGRTDLTSRKYQVLYDILDKNIPDKSILNAAIALEYEPENGLVYSVLYSDKNKEFTYTAKSRNGKVNICDRREKHRSDYMIGYYGVDR